MACYGLLKLVYAVRMGLHGTIACLAIMDLLAINNEMKKHGALETWLLDSLFSDAKIFYFFCIMYACALFGMYLLIYLTKRNVIIHYFVVAQLLFIVFVIYFVYVRGIPTPIMSRRIYDFIAGAGDRAWYWPTTLVGDAMILYIVVFGREKQPTESRTTDEDIKMINPGQSV